jgi:hypothetical protein
MLSRYLISLNGPDIQNYWDVGLGPSPGIQDLSRDHDVSETCLLAFLRRLWLCA